METKMEDDKVVGVGGMVERSAEETEALIMDVIRKTEEEQAEWSEKLVAMEHWRWVAGMSTRDREIVCSVAKNGILRCYSPSSKRITERLAEDCRPNLVDPLTVLAIISLVRVAYPTRDFVVQFPASIPFHDHAHHMIQYLAGGTDNNVCSDNGAAATADEG
jgi:hypothetical protein